MAIFHMQVKTVSRSTGRSAVAAAAYRTGTLLTNLRDGMVHDYSRRGGVVSSELLMPDHGGTVMGFGGFTPMRDYLWNMAEAAETRKNSTVAREYELALPSELGEAAQRQLALGFASELVKRFGVAADVAIHAPNTEGDQRNHHAHILTTTRVVSPDGKMGAKTRELDDRETGPGHVEALRELWAIQVNHALERIQAEARVDHRSHKRRGLTEVPGEHVGLSAMAMERRAQREHDELDGEPDGSPPVTERVRRQMGRRVKKVAISTERDLVQAGIEAATTKLGELERLQALPEIEAAPVGPEELEWQSLPLPELRREVDRMKPATTEAERKPAKAVEAALPGIGFELEPLPSLWERQEQERIDRMIAMMEESKALHEQIWAQEAAQERQEAEKRQEQERAAKAARDAPRPVLGDDHGLDDDDDQPWKPSDDQPD